MNLDILFKTVGMLEKKSLCSKCLQKKLRKPYTTVVSRLEEYLRAGIVIKKAERCSNCNTRAKYIYSLTNKGKTLIRAIREDTVKSMERLAGMGYACGGRPPCGLKSIVLETIKLPSGKEKKESLGALGNLKK